MPQLIQQQLLAETLRGICSAGGALVMSTNPLRGGGVLTIDVVSCRAVTASTVATIELTQGPVVAGVHTLTLTNANSWYRTRVQVRVPSDWNIRVTFSAAGVSKLCEASVYGYVEYPE